MDEKFRRNMISITTLCSARSNFTSDSTLSPKAASSSTGDNPGLGLDW